MSTSNIFSNVYIYGNCTVKGTLTTLGGSAVSQWTTSGSLIYYTTGNVGIGTAIPQNSLTVFNSGVSISNVSSGTTLTAAYSAFVNTADSRRAFVGMDGTGLFAISTGALALGTDNTPIIFAPSYGSGEKMRILTTGYVGIGTTNPGSLLTVSGGVGIGSGYNAFTAPTGGLIVQGNVGIGTSNPGVNALQVTGNVVTQGFTSNATNTVFNYDTLTVPFLNATQVFASSITTATTGTALQVTGNLYATDTIASANPMMFRNRIINGDMRISQRGTSNVGVFATSCYFIDRMTNYFGASSGGYTAYQNTLSTNDTGPYQQGFRYSANVVITSTVTSNPVLCGQVLEGWTVQDFNWGTSFGSSVTISYWFKSSATGTFSHGIRNQGIYTYSYTGSFTYSTAGVWQYVSYTIPPPPAGSVWRTDNLGSWEVWVGGSFQASAAAGWNAGASFGLSGSANWYSTGGYIAYTGFQLEKGLTASPFEFRPYGTELVLCQRYYQKSYSLASVPGTINNTTDFVTASAVNTDSIGGTRFIQTMRAAPATVNIYGTATGTLNRATVFAGGADTSAITTVYSSQVGISYIYINANNLTQGNGYRYQYIADAEL